MKKPTIAQQRILSILSDHKSHPLLPDLKGKGYYNQHPAIRALEKRELIKKVYENGYYSLWCMV